MEGVIKWRGTRERWRNSNGRKEGIMRKRKMETHTHTYINTHTHSAELRFDSWNYSS